jgi:hypothetical protein
LRIGHKNNKPTASFLLAVGYGCRIKNFLGQHPPAPEDTSAQQQAQQHIWRDWECDDMNSVRDSKVERRQGQPPATCSWMNSTNVRKQENCCRIAGAARQTGSSGVFLPPGNKQNILPARSAAKECKRKLGGQRK